MALPCFSSSRSDLSNFLESISVIHQSKNVWPEYSAEYVSNSYKIITFVVYG